LRSIETSNDEIYKSSFRSGNNNGGMTPISGRSAKYLPSDRSFLPEHKDPRLDKLIEKKDE